MNDQLEGLSADQLTGLRRTLNCAVVTKSDQEYDSARRIWNGMIDRLPSVIVRPASIADVIQSVRFAREHGIAASVRGGGHSVAGKSVADGAMMIDLSLMRDVQIDAGRKTGLVQGGATWGALIAKARSSGSRPREVSSRRRACAGLPWEGALAG